jgi:hypothetical protein
MKRPAIRPVDVLMAIFLMALLMPGIIDRAFGEDLPPGYEDFSGVTLWADGTTATIFVQSSAVPDHNSPYFPLGDPRYEAYNGSNPNYMQNPNQIQTQTIEFHIPLNPQEATVHQSTPLGPIGVALNGVPFFNQYAGPGQPLTNEINSFDQYNGHPQQTGVYHYHVEPLALTALYGEDALLGFLLDGFPVYGPMENGDPVMNADLDTYHGHSHATADYPSGIYHYHFTADAPYLNGAGFYGVPGSVTYTFSSTPTPTSTPTPSAVGGITDLTGAGGSNGIGSAGIAVAAGAAVLLLSVVAGTWVAVRRGRGG